MNPGSHINQNFEVEEQVDLRELFAKIMSKWYWFVICGFLGISIGYIFHRISSAEFEVSSTLLINEENKSIGSEFLFENMGFNSTVNAADQIGILSSYMLNLEAITQLDWNTAWYKKDLFRSTDLYRSSPFEVIVLENSINLTGIPVYITQVDDASFTVGVDDEYVSKAGKTHIELELRGKFGDPVSSEYFNFVISKRNNYKTEENFKYYFVIFDITYLPNLFREKIEITQNDQKSNLIEVKILDSNPQRSVDYLNSLTRAFIQFGLSEKNKASGNTVNFIDSQLSGIVDSLQQAGQDYTSFRTQNKIMDLSQEAGFIMDRMKEVETTQAMATMRMEYYKNLLKYLGDAKLMEQMVAPSVVGITDVSLNNMVVKLSELYSRRNMLSLTVQEKNPSLIAIDNEISYIQQSLQENLKNSISNTEVEIQNLEQRKNTTAIQISRLPKTEQNMVNIKRNFDLNNELYTFLLQKRAEAAIAKASTTPDVQVLDIARIENATKVGPNRLMKLLIGLFGGLMLPAIVLFISDYLNNKVTKKADIEKVTSIPTIGVIAHNNLKTDFPVLKFPHSGLTESFRSLRTNLQYLLEKDQSNVIAVQSMISGEGKSFVALNLALAFAINNKKVLVIDGDLRKPQLHVKFSDSNEKGLTNYLMNKATFDEVVKESKTKNLFYTTTGPVLRNTAELLDSDLLKDFFAEAKKNFSFIIFNNSPISIVTDGILIGNLSDSNLIVLRHNFSLKGHLKLINDFAAQGVIKNISIIFNDMKMDGYGYYANRNNGYGYFKDSTKKTSSKWKFKTSKETLDHV